ncbi:MAG: hypothetical protein JWO09_2812 [Bacteroidetes bacterium]|nr:hypothetical protein [Bacteroidota bacterium]
MIHIYLFKGEAENLKQSRHEFKKESYEKPKTFFC